MSKILKFIGRHSRSIMLAVVGLSLAFQFEYAGSFVLALSWIFTMTGATLIIRHVLFSKFDLQKKMEEANPNVVVSCIIALMAVILLAGTAVFCGPFLVN